MTYWVAGREEDGTCRSRNLAAYLEDSGEVWMSDGVAFTERKARDSDLYQVFAIEPVNGLKVELNFDWREAARARREPRPAPQESEP